MGDRAPPEGSDDPTGRLSEAEIAVHWGEERTYPPPESIRRTANLSDPGVMERFGLGNFPECFREYADLLRWSTPWTETLDARRPPFYRWFVGGSLNAEENCVERHLAERGDAPAVIFVPEPEAEAPVRIWYRELSRRVQELSVVLRGELGLRAGDRVTVHLPMIPELVVTMLACARLGLVHSVVFGGFSGEAAGHRSADCDSRLFVTVDGYWRGGKKIDHLAQLVPALAAATGDGHPPERVLVWRRSPETSFSSVPLSPGRDVDATEAVARHRGASVPAVPRAANDPLFLMYTSGTTGGRRGASTPPAATSPTWPARRGGS